MRAVAEIEEGRSGDRIVVTELPYQTSVEVIEQKITELVRAGDLDGISGMRNASANQQPRLVIELKRDANANVVLNNLYKQTPLQTSFGVNMLALVDGVPRTLNLAQALSHYIDHQIEVIQRRSAVPPGQGAQPGAHRRGPPARHRHARCRHRDDPGLRRPPRGPHRADGRALLVHRGAGHAHPRHDARPPDPARPLRAGGRDGGAARHHRRARGDPVGRRQAARCHRDRDDGDPRQVRQPAPERDHPRPRRDGRGGPHLRRGDRRHDDPGRLHQVRGRGRLPHPGPRRPGRPGGPAEGGGPGQPGGPHLGPRLPAALLEPGEGLPAAGTRDPDEGPDGPGHGGGQPGAAGAERVDHGHHRHAGVRARSVPGVRHRARSGEEDGVERVRQVPPRGVHRHQPARRRRAGPGGGHVGRRRPLRGDAQRHDHPLQRGGRAGHGPRRRRRAGHPPARRGCGRVAATWRRTTPTS